MIKLYKSRFLIRGTKYNPFYRDTEIITMGPPSSGGAHVIQMLNILESHNVSKIEHNSSEYINLLTEIMKYAYADRSKYLGDPDYYEVPVSQIISKNYAKTINEKIKIGKVTPSSVIYPGTFSDNESYETTHFSIVDKEMLDDGVFCCFNIFSISLVA